ncbi:pleckstrin homology domain-containing family O member 2 [Parambassis ranga]|uniref:Pleckstrin homology domain-containing family O member 2 n=1 Tax=Parambassis ranga TaxID=210632 RepID=A0A6P7HZK8_9TELE|nr:pleckstrin homology domain-containing family O member 2-like [Parambassis ranga]
MIMEDGVKEELAQHKEPKFLAKAGWVKKGQGKLLASYKDRYIHVEKTELVVYENEDLQNCLERIDLENYDKCHELKSPFKKKHRLVLIRSPKSVNKAHDVKFQAQNSEEKEAWIKALSDGISRAKNKVFDEVKVEDSSNLEHVTRTRPKGNRNRRPPTRIHMKEVAGVSSDGILRLDLDLEDAVMPNGTYNSNVDSTETPQKSVAVSMPASNTSQAEEETHTKPADSPQKKIIKPPMPPIKEAKPSSSPEDEPDKNNGSEKKILQPPMPPAKDSKPHASPVEEATEETTPQMSPDSRKKTGPPPPTPPNKPSSSRAEVSQSRPNTQPPVPPSKDKKSSHSLMETDQQAEGTDEGKEKEEDGSKGKNTTAEEPDEVDQSVCDNEAKSLNVEEESKNKPQIPTEPLTNSPFLTSKNIPEEPLNPDTNTENSSTISEPNEEPDSTVSDTSASSLVGEEATSNSEVLSVDVSLNDPSTDTLSLSPQLCQKKKKAEEKSVDSGQHSDDESEGSGSEDALAASTAALRGSHAGLDVLDTSENDSQISVNLRPAQAAPKPKVKPKILPSHCSQRTSPLKPSTKARSASIGDLLSAPEVSIQVKEPSRARAESSNDDVMKLETQVALEIENTSELLSRVSQAHGRDAGEGLPEDLLAKAMEKLKKADHVLREVKKLKLADKSRNRKSW